LRFGPLACLPVTSLVDVPWISGELFLSVAVAVLIWRSAGNAAWKALGDAERSLAVPLSSDELTAGYRSAARAARAGLVSSSAIGCGLLAAAKLVIGVWIVWDGGGDLRDLGDTRWHWVFEGIARDFVCVGVVGVLAAHLTFTRRVAHPVAAGLAVFGVPLAALSLCNVFALELHLPIWVTGASGQPLIVQFGAWATVLASVAGAVFVASWVALIAVALRALEQRTTLASTARDDHRACRIALALVGLCAGTGLVAAFGHAIWIIGAEGNTAVAAPVWVCWAPIVARLMQLLAVPAALMILPIRRNDGARRLRERESSWRMTAAFPALLLAAFAIPEVVAVEPDMATNSQAVSAWTRSVENGWFSTDGAQHTTSTWPANVAVIGVLLVASALALVPWRARDLVRAHTVIWLALIGAVVGWAHVTGWALAPSAVNFFAVGERWWLPPWLLAMLPFVAASAVWLRTPRDTALTAFVVAFALTVVIASLNHLAWLMADDGFSSFMLSVASPRDGIAAAGIVGPIAAGGCVVLHLLMVHQQRPAHAATP
jgi:hypothetical protein